MGGNGVLFSGVTESSTRMGWRSLLPSNAHVTPVLHHLLLLLLLMLFELMLVFPMSYEDMTLPTDCTGYRNIPVLPPDPALPLAALWTAWYSLPTAI